MAKSRSEQLAQQVSRHGVVAEAFEILAENLGPFIDDRMKDYFPDESSWAEAAANRLGRPAEHGATDPLFQLLVVRRFWGPVFADFYRDDLRKIVGQLIDIRNQWAHFRLPENLDHLERAVLAVERLLAPVSPGATSDLRRLRSQLRSAGTSRAASDDALDAVSATTSADEDAERLTADAQQSTEIDVVGLEAQLSETESVFKELQDRYGSLETELRDSRQVAARKQLRLATLERQLVEIEGRSLAAEAFLAEERHTRYRIEWLFVALLATLLLFMVLSNT